MDSRSQTAKSNDLDETKNIANTGDDDDASTKSQIIDPALQIAKKINEDSVSAEESESPNEHVKRLNKIHDDLDAEDLLRVMIHEEFPGRIALVSSFGTEAAVLLELVARVNPDTPIIFLETGMHFAQTLQYKKTLTERFGLTNVLDIRPDPDDLKAEDPENALWQWDTDKCCQIRKVSPLNKTLKGYDAWINGRKQMHGGERLRLPRIELNGKHIKVNPLARWTREDVAQTFDKLDLPQHPLKEQNYLSVGCWPCTQPSVDGDVRSGRWAGSDKSECGIHGPLTLSGS